MDAKTVSCFKCHERVPLTLWAAHRNTCLAGRFDCHACGGTIYAYHAAEGRGVTRHVSSGECDRQAADPAYAARRESLALRRAQKRAGDALVRAAADAAGEG